MLFEDCSQEYKVTWLTEERKEYIRSVNVAPLDDLGEQSAHITLVV